MAARQSDAMQTDTNKRRQFIVFTSSQNLWLKVIISDKKKTDLSEHNSLSVWNSWDEIRLRVVLQEDVVALENNVRLSGNEQRAMRWFVAYSVAELPAIGSHLVAEKRWLFT